MTDFRVGDRVRFRRPSESVSINGIWSGQTGQVTDVLLPGDPRLTSRKTVKVLLDDTSFLSPGTVRTFRECWHTPVHLELIDVSTQELAEVYQSLGVQHTCNDINPSPIADCPVCKVEGDENSEEEL